MTAIRSFGTLLLTARFDGPAQRVARFLNETQSACSLVSGSVVFLRSLRGIRGHFSLAGISAAGSQAAEADLARSCEHLNPSEISAASSVQDALVRFFTGRSAAILFGSDPSPACISALAEGEVRQFLRDLGGHHDLDMLSSIACTIFAGRRTGPEARNLPAVEDGVETALDELNLISRDFTSEELGALRIQIKEVHSLLGRARDLRHARLVRAAETKLEHRAGQWLSEHSGLVGTSTYYRRWRDPSLRALDYQRLLTEIEQMRPENQRRRVQEGSPRRKRVV